MIKKTQKKSRGKLSPKSKRTIFDNQDSSPESEDSCTYDHKEYATGYTAEDDRRYWKEEAELFGIICIGCEK